MAERAETLRVARSLGLGLVLAWLCGCEACEPDYSKVTPPPRGTGLQVPKSQRASKPAQGPYAAPLPEATPIDQHSAPVRAAQPEQAELPPRDYAAELQASVGSPLQCLQPRLAADAPMQVSIAIEATVLESGYVSRGSARAASLDAAELACVTQRVQSARLGPGVEGAPRTVRASLTLTLSPAPAAPAPAAQAAEVKPPGTVTPAGDALPAQGPAVPRSPNAIPYELPTPSTTDPEAIPNKLPDPIPLQPTQP